MENEAIGVQLVIFQKLLEKIDENQEKQWRAITSQDNQIVALRGEIETANQTGAIHLKVINKKLDELDDDLVENLIPINKAVEKNTTFRQNSEGFSWSRHGLPMLSFVMVIVMLIISLWPKN